MTTSSVKNTHKTFTSSHTHTQPHIHIHTQIHTHVHTCTQMLRPQITGERELSLEEFDKIDGGDRL